MTIQRAREILGDDIANLSDEAVAELNNDTAEMTSNLLRFYISHPVRKDVIDVKKLVV